MLGKDTIVTNGDQTDTIYEGLEKGLGLEQSLRCREFEPDGPNYTPRISGVMHIEESAFDFANKGAIIVLFSVPKVEAQFPLPLFDVYKKELTIRGSFVNPDTHARAVALINSSKVDFGPIITHRFPLAQLPEAIAAQQGSESIKVVVDCQA